MALPCGVNQAASGWRTVALLIDRPPATTGVLVDLFGRPFRASIAAAELARANRLRTVRRYRCPHRPGLYRAIIARICL